MNAGLKGAKESGFEKVRSVAEIRTKNTGYAKEMLRDMRLQRKPRHVEGKPFQLIRWESVAAGYQPEITILCSFDEEVADALHLLGVKWRYGTSTQPEDQNND